MRLNEGKYARPMLDWILHVNADPSPSPTRKRATMNINELQVYQEPWNSFKVRIHTMEKKRKISIGNTQNRNASTDEHWHWASSKSRRTMTAATTNSRTCHFSGYGYKVVSDAFDVWISCRKFQVSIAKWLGWSNDPGLYLYIPRALQVGPE